MTAGGPTRLGVVGSGTMGAGIAELAASRGIPTILYDIAESSLEGARDRVERRLARAVARGTRTSADAALTGERLHYTTSLEALAPCGLLVEAAPESFDIKVDLLRALGTTAPEATLATNTSSLSIAALADGSGCAERVIGLHFFNPPSTMPLVELISTARTDGHALAVGRRTAERLGKQVIEVPDGPGFLVNRCARPYYGEALRIVEDGIADVPSVDRACCEVGGFPRGPFELMDLIGVDVSLAVTRAMWEQSFGEPRWRPSPLQVRLVSAGRVGMKAGGGFYDAGVTWRDLPSTTQRAREVVERIVAQLVNEAAFAAAAGIATREEIDAAMVMALSYPRGPWAWAQSLGPRSVVAILDDLWETEHDPRYRTAPLLRRWAAEGEDGSSGGEDQGRR